MKCYDAVHAPDEPTASAISILRFPGFARFYVAQTLNAFGDSSGAVVLPLLVYRLTGSAELLAWALAANILPTTVLGLVGGALADVFDRRRILLASDACRIVVLLLLAIALAYSAFAVPLVFVAMFALGTASALSGGAESATVPFLVGKVGLKTAYSTLGATARIVTITAQALGGAILGTAGPVAAVLANAAAFGGSATAIGGMRCCGPHHTNSLTVASVRSSVCEGISFVRHDSVLRTLSVSSVGFWFVVAFADVARIPLLKNALNASDLQTGTFFAGITLGVAGGMVLAGVTRWQFGAAVTIMYALQAFGDLLGSQAASVIAATAAFGLGGFSYGYVVVARAAWLARITPPDRLGSVFGVTTFLSMGGWFAGTVLAGPVVAAAGPRVAVATSMITFLAIAVLLASSPFSTDRR